tara:strand:+ start:7162 stop:7551 length:390 start_codon:yes stop_codon:yes gene_type:complete
MSWLSITGVDGNKVTKYQPFENESDAESHAQRHSGFVVPHPGGNMSLWSADAVSKTVTRASESAEQEFITNQLWSSLREKRNNLLKECDWWALTDVNMSNSQKLYRQQLRDLPQNTVDPSNVTWPELQE